MNLLSQKLLESEKLPPPLAMWTIHFLVPLLGPLVIYLEVG